MCNKIIKDGGDGMFSIFACLVSPHKSTIKFGLGSFLHFTQVYSRHKDLVYSPVLAIGLNGGLKHLQMAVLRSLENVDYESLLYSSKIFANLA
jgi:hypothetical protein